MPRILRLLAVPLLGVCLLPGALAQVFEQYSGQETFHRFCASCHGTSGAGDGPVAAGLPITVPDLTLLRKRQGDAFPAATLRKIIDGREIVIYHGTRYMPVWGYEFWVEEGADEAAQKRVEVIIGNLIDYIESIQRQPSSGGSQSSSSP
jgi:mono/diheme cytochrome c family protein